MDPTWCENLASKIPGILTDALNSSMNNLAQKIASDPNFPTGRSTQARVVQPPQPQAKPPTEPPVAPPAQQQLPHTPPVITTQPTQPPPKKQEPGSTTQSKPPSTRQPPPQKSPKKKPPEPTPPRRQPPRRQPPRHNPNPPHAPAVVNMVDDEWETEAPIDEEEQNRRLLQYAITNKRVRYCPK